MERALAVIFAAVLSWLGRNAVLCFGWGHEDYSFYPLATIPAVYASFIGVLLFEADLIDRIIRSAPRSRYVVIPLAVVLLFMSAIAIWVSNPQMVGLLN